MEAQRGKLLFKSHCGKYLSWDLSLNLLSPEFLP